jgi:hypothetical protein
VPYIIGPGTPLGRRGPDGSRQLALVMVAIYDAIIATSRPLTTQAIPLPRDATSINVVADDFAMSRLWAGIHYRTDIVVGLQLGRQVAAQVINRANADGSGPAPTLASTNGECDT